MHLKAKHRNIKWHCWKMPCFHHIPSKHAAQNHNEREEKSCESSLYQAATNVNRHAYIPWYESGAAKV